jgi:hypothetical protein
LIEAYEKHGIDQLSMGYSTDIQWRTGVTDAGESYDAVQTAIRGNHLAVVPVARGGDKLRVGDADRNSSHLDDGKCPSCGAEMQGDSCPECNYTKDGEPKMKVLVIDGLNASVADDQSAAIIQRHIDSLLKQVADAGTDFENFKKKKKEDDEVKDAALKQVEAKDGEIAVLKQQLKDAEITPAKLDLLVKDRLAVVDAASKLLPKDFAYDGKSLVEIRKAAVETKLGDAAKTMSDGAIEGAFTALTAGAVQASGSQPIADALSRPRNGVSTEAQKVRDEAHKAFTDDLANAWKKPNAA